MIAGFRVTSAGVALGSSGVGNDALAGELGVTPDWIDERSGFARRMVSLPGESSGVLAVRAASEAIARAGRRTPDAVLCATFTPDRLLCPLAPTIASQIGVPGVGAFDVNAACAGGVVAFVLGAGMIHARTAETVLVVATDTVTRHLAPGDRSTRILFADGAGAVLLARDGDSGSRLTAVLMGSDGERATAFHAGPIVPNGDGPPFVRMAGQQLYRFAVERVPALLRDLCREAGIGPGEVDRVVLHQANPRLLHAIRDRSDVPADRWVLNSDDIGNTVSASVLVSLARSLEDRPPRKGERIALLGFGAGLSWAGALLEW